MASNTVGKYCVTYDKRKLKDAFLKYLTQKDRCDNTPITIRMCFKVYTVTYESDLKLVSISAVKLGLFIRSFESRPFDFATLLQGTCP